jgi:hypothetical protein
MAILADPEYDTFAIGDSGLQMFKPMQFHNGFPTIGTVALQ